MLATVLGVSEVASKEHGIEKMLDKMLGLWNDVDYNVQSYRATGTYVIKGTDDINTLLDDHIVATQAMSFSPYKAVFQERIDAWEASLRLVQEVTTCMMVVQRNWMYLQPIFESDDIMRQLPTEGKKFREADRTYRRIMLSAHKHPKTIPFCENDETMMATLENTPGSNKGHLEDSC